VNSAAGLECAAKEGSHVNDVAICNLNASMNLPWLPCDKTHPRVLQPVLYAPNRAIAQNWHVKHADGIIKRSVCIFVQPILHP
jgi:hypothetical protein